MAATDVAFADSVARQIDAELRRLKEEELPSMPVAVPTDDVDFQRLHCFVDSHEQADRLAAEWRADLVLWGYASHTQVPTIDQRVEVEQHVRTGEIVAESSSSVAVAKVEIHPPRPYAVCPRATLHRPEANLRRSTEAVDLTSLAHLDLPRLQATEPFQLVYFTLGLHFYERGHPEIAARFFERSVVNLILPREKNLSTLYLYLGRSYLELPGGASRAIEFSQSALKMVEGTQSSDEAVLLNTIGEALQVQGKTTEALRYFRLALAIDEKATPGDDPRTARDLNNIGLTLRAAGKPEEAFQHYRRALEITQKTLGSAHPNVANCLNNIGFALLSSGHAAEAIEHFRRALAIYQKALGSDHPNVGNCLNNIGFALQAAGNTADAMHYFRQALMISEKALGHDHPRFATCLNNIGSVLQRQGRFSEAVDYYQRALAINEKALGSEHPDVAVALSNLGAALMAQGQPAEALKFYRRALVINEHSLGEEHPDVVQLRWIVKQCAATSQSQGSGQP